METEIYSKRFGRSNIYKTKLINQQKTVKTGDKFNQDIIMRTFMWS